LFIDQTRDLAIGDKALTWVASGASRAARRCWRDTCADAHRCTCACRERAFAICGR